MKDDRKGRIIIRSGIQGATIAQRSDKRANGAD